MPLMNSINYQNEARSDLNKVLFSEILNCIYFFIKLEITKNSTRVAELRVAVTQGGWTA